MLRFIAILLLFPMSAVAESSVTVSGDRRCITSDGLPDHATGRFPTRGNPNKISRQNIRFCVDATPEYSGRAHQVPTIGIAINGIIIRPGTADWYDASSPRKHSRDKSSGWRLDGLGAASQLGMDQNNAHVDNRGLYHYHGIAEPLVDLDSSSMIGWAADGFEIHYLGDGARSSYQLKDGEKIFDFSEFDKNLIWQFDGHFSDSILSGFMNINLSGTKLAGWIHLKLYNNVHYVPRRWPFLIS